ncbi:response regulator [bacterium]|nr:response regulator [bacterium]MBP9809165.1 response regulator [bacterium]
MTAHILVVEDDRKIAEVLQDCLAAAGYEVEVVHSAEAGSAMLATNSYNLLLLDWQLPKASGLGYWSY